jgi:hypothetical protein
LAVITSGYDFSGDAVGVELELNPERVEFVFNGDTISLDLKEKTAYINGETSKKVYSVEGNELMQTSNIYSGTSVNATEKMYGDTLRQYANGKETATIECSISDYDENDGSKSSIRVDNSTGKMTFEIGDKVIPMVYVGNGEDRPMSKYNNGQPKVFEVLGRKFSYDGEPLQILELQEVTLDTE